MRAVCRNSVWWSLIAEDQNDVRRGGKRELKYLEKREALLGEVLSDLPLQKTNPFSATFLSAQLLNH